MTDTCLLHRCGRSPKELFLQNMLPWLAWFTGKVSCPWPCINNSILFEFGIIWVQQNTILQLHLPVLGCFIVSLCVCLVCCFLLQFFLCSVSCFLASCSLLCFLLSLSRGWRQNAVVSWRWWWWWWWRWSKVFDGNNTFGPTKVWGGATWKDKHLEKHTRQIMQNQT